MRILVISQGLAQPRGGAEASLLSLVRHLALSHEITVVSGESCPHGSPFGKEVTFETYKIRSMKFAVPGFRGVRRIFRRIMNTRDLYSHAKTIEQTTAPHLIISQKPPFPYTSNTTPTAVFVRDLEYIDFFGFSSLNAFLTRGLQSWWGRRMLARLKESTVVIANSKYTQSALQKKGVTSTYIPPPVVSSSLSALQPNFDGPVIFLSATMSTHKGAPLLIEIARRLPHVKFIATGADIEGLARKLPANVTWHAWVDDTDRLISTASLVIVPSQWPEPFGRVVVEAHRHAVPVIASRSGGLPEVVGDGGITIEPYNDVDRWVQCIESCRTDSDLYSTLSRKALQNAEHFDPDKVLRSMETLLVNTSAILV